MIGCDREYFSMRGIGLRPVGWKDEWVAWIKGMTSWCLIQPYGEIRVAQYTLLTNFKKKLKN